MRYWALGSDGLHTLCKGSEVWYTWRQSNNGWYNLLGVTAVVYLVSGL